MTVRRRPVYLIVRPTGVYDAKGQEAVTIIAIKQTSLGADKVVEATPGSRVQKGYVTPE